MGSQRVYQRPGRKYLTIGSGGEERLCYDFAQHPEHAANLGRLVVGWTEVELSMVELFSLLLRSPPWHAGAAFCAVVNNSARMNLIRALASNMVRAPKYRVDVHELMGLAQRLVTRRNAYVHKRWINWKGEPYIVEPSESVLRFQRRKVRSDELMKVHAEIQALAQRIRSFCVTYSRKHPIAFPLDELPPPHDEKWRALRARQRPGSARLLAIPGARKARKPPSHRQP